MLLSLESSMIVGALGVRVPGATRPLRKGLERVGRPGSKNMCKREWGFPRNLGDPVVSTKKVRKGIPDDQPQAHRLAFGGGGRENNRMHSWYRQAKETKCGETDPRKSQCLDSTVEAGERMPVRTLSREARHREYGAVVGKYDECLEIREAYPRNSNG